MRDRRQASTAASPDHLLARLWPTRIPDVEARAWAAVAVLVVAAAGLFLLVGHDDAGLDLAVYRDAWARAGDGRSLYAGLSPDGFPWTYPPSALLVLSPLGALPAGLAGVVWLLVSAGCLVVSVRAVVLRLGADPDGRRAWRAVAWVLVTWGAWFALVLGQVGPLLLALCAVDVLLGRGRRWNGALVGVAAAVKLTPALFLVYLVVVGRRRAALVGAGVWAGLTALAWLWLPEDSAAYWLGGTVLDVSRNVTLAATGNQSAAAWTYRLTGVDGPVLGMVSAAVALAGLLAAWSLHRRRQEVVAVATVGVTAAAAAPIGWVHQWLWLPLLVVATCWYGGSSVRRLVALVTAAVVTLSLSLAPLLVGPDAPVLARVASGAYLVSATALVAVLLADRTHVAADAAAPAPSRTS